MQNMSGQRVRREGVRHRVPDHSPEVRLRCDVAGARHHQHLAVVGQREMDRVDRHQICEGAPLSLKGGLGQHRRRLQRHGQGQRGRSSGKPSFDGESTPISCVMAALGSWDVRTTPPTASLSPGRSPALSQGVATQPASIVGASADRSLRKPHRRAERPRSCPSPPRTGPSLR